MSALTSYTRKIFGGKPAATDTVLSGFNIQDQANAEATAVGTIRRVFKGPQARGEWSYHINPVSAAGATSNLKFYYSNLPNPDPTNPAHWVDSGITAVALDATTTKFATVTGAFCEWIKAEATIITSGGSMWGWVRSEGSEVR